MDDCLSRNLSRNLLDHQYVAMHISSAVKARMTGRAKPRIMAKCAKAPLQILLDCRRKIESTNKAPINAAITYVILPSSMWMQAKRIDDHRIENHQEKRRNNRDMIIPRNINSSTNGGSIAVIIGPLLAYIPWNSLEASPIAMVKPMNIKRISSDLPLKFVNPISRQ